MSGARARAMPGPSGRSHWPVATTTARASHLPRTGIDLIAVSDAKHGSHRNARFDRRAGKPRIVFKIADELRHGHVAHPGVGALIRPVREPPHPIGRQQAEGVPSARCASALQRGPAPARHGQCQVGQGSGSSPVRPAPRRLQFAWTRLIVASSAASCRRLPRLPRSMRA